jgi:eukaryotic-like serine/threonine-protein kinase
VTADLREKLQRALGGTYALDRELPGGGMARVFVATEHALGRQVVVKVLPAELAGQVSVERFKREIAVAARLQHPHIVPLLTAGDAGGLPYFTMPLVKGDSLRVRLETRGELPLNDAVRLLREIATALAHAHDHGIVHRDIKPDNILLSGGSAMVTDFGVAKALSASSHVEEHTGRSMGVAMGTPAYMAPEQATADPNVDHRADIYTFGVLAYELLTGQPPFVGHTRRGLLAAHVTELPEPIIGRRSTIPPMLAALVMRCLEKRAADRPQAASELVHTLDAIHTPSGGLHPTAALAAMGARPRRWLLPAIAMAALAVITAVALRRAPPTATAEEKSIAVIPDALQGSDTASASLSEGMAETLINQLSRMPQLVVRSRGTSFAFAGSRDTPAEQGRKLGVATLLNVSVRRAGERLRVTVGLTRASDGAVIWSNQYDRTLRDVFALQDEIARTTVDSLRVTLGSGEQQLLKHRGTENPEAYDLYLNGRFLQYRFSEGGLRRAIALYAEALQKDSGYALAWAATAEAWQWLNDDWVPPREAMPKIEEAVQRALALDSTLAEAHAMNVTVLLYNKRDVGAALREAELARRLDPRSITAMGIHAEALQINGRVEESAILADSQAALEPGAPLKRLIASAHKYEAGHLEEALADLDLAISLDSAFGAAWNWKAKLLLASGRPQEALAALAHGKSQESSNRSLRAVAYATLGRVAEARALVDTLIALSKVRYVNGSYIAEPLLALGDRDGALTWLKHMVDERATMSCCLWFHATWKPLREDPRFQALLREVEAQRK